MRLPGKYYVWLYGAGVMVESMGTQVVLSMIPPVRGKGMGGWLDEVDEASFFR